MNNVMKEFDSICKVPRPSLHEEKIRDYLYNWALSKNIYVEKDEFNNILMRKPASKGYEDYCPIALQAHTDMVCEKSEDVEHNFFEDEIKYYIDGDIVSTRLKTTLGADDGVGMSIILSILSDEKLNHPEIEAIFTSAEEEDFSGADNFDVSKIKSKFLINIDHCNDSEIVKSSAGGITLDGCKDIEFIELDENYMDYEISVSGFIGGHSGEDIHRGLGNSNIILFRFLDSVSDLDYYVSDVAGGSFRLAIPRKSSVKLGISNRDYEVFEKRISEFSDILKKEFQKHKDTVSISLKKLDDYEGRYIKREIFEDAKNYILTSPVDIQIMSNTLENMVDCSCNLGEIYIKDSKLMMISDIRASFESQKEFILNKLKKLSKVYGVNYNIWGDYPSWEYNLDSKLSELVKDVYERRSGNKADFLAIHAGLECSFFNKKIPDMDIVSIGSNAWHYHSPKECFSLSSLNYFYDCLVEILENAKF